MFRAQFCAILGIGVMLAAASAQARELEFSVESRMGGENNIFRSSSNKKSDGYFELAPEIALRTRNKKLNYDFRYEPSYSTYFETSGVDGFDHRASGIMSLRPTAKDTLDFSSTYRNIRLVRVEDISAPSDPIPVLAESDRERYRLSTARITYRRSLNARWSAQAVGFFDDVDYSRSDSIDSRGYGTELRTSYTMLPTTAVGISGSFRRRDSDSRPPFRPSETTNIWNVSAFVQHSFTPTFSALAQVGPSFIDTDRDFESPIPDTTEGSTSYFATVRLAKEWRRSSGSVGYTRSDSAGSDTSSASILDEVRFNYHHRFTRTWSANVTGIWVHREEIVSIAGQSKDETTQYLAHLRLIHNFSDNLSINARYSALVQDQNQSNGGSSIGPIHTGYVSLRYTFDPIVF